jgi:hypothetical protein
MKLHFAPTFRLAAVVVGAAIGSQSAQAGITPTYEAAGVQQTSVSNVLTETFNGLAGPSGTPLTSLVSSIGTYTAGANTAIILEADQYGGANGTDYVAVGSQAGGAGSMTLQLNGPADYFGIWWSAIDNQNTLQFYSGASLVGTFNSTNLGPFSNDYYGNPNAPLGRNTGEPYVYINFTGTAGTTFDRIVFTNSSSTGFESDNHSIHSVPEPSALAMGAAASTLGLALARRRGRNA